MAGHKHLKGIAHGLLGTFVSRNNDIDGYWGIGVLRSFALEHNLSSLALDLIDKSPNFAKGSPVQSVEERYRGWLSSVLAKEGVDQQLLRSAEIRLRFTTFAEFPDTIRDTRGEPFVCQVGLTSDQGIVYSASRIGVCAPHEPAKESRSVRIAGEVPDNT